MAGLPANQRARSSSPYEQDPYPGLTPQKTNNPVRNPAAPNLATGMAAPAAAPTPARMSWDQLSSQQFDLGQFGNAQGFNNQGLQNSFTNLGKAVGFSGNALSPTTFSSSYEGESGPVTQQMQGQAANPDLLRALQNYQYGLTDTGDGRQRIDIFNSDGSSVGNYLHGTKDSGFDRFAERAIPLGIAALGGAALGGFIPGAEIGAAGAGGAGAAAGEAAAAGAAGDIGALGLSESVYGLGGALGEGAAAGTVGGLSGSTAAFGGLGSTLPAGVGFGGAAGLGAMDFGLNTVGGADPAGIVPGGSPTPELDALMGGTDLEASLAGNTFGGAAGSIGAAGQGEGILSSIAAALQNPGGALASAGSSALDFAKANPQLAAMGVGALGSLTGSKPEMPSTGAAGSGNLTPGAQQVAGSLGALDFSGIPGLKTSAGDRNTFNQEATDAAYGLQTRYLDPQIQQQQKALEARLSEQGFVPGTPAYNQAMQNFMDTNNRAYASARDSSILQGAQIGQGDFRNALSDATLNNSASAQALESYLAKRNQPINERNALLTGDQMVYGQQLDKYNAKVAESNNRNQALSQLALALGMYLG